MKLFTFTAMRSRVLGLLATVGMSVLSACSYTNGYNSTPPTPCNLPTTVSYQADVWPILKANCRDACHNPTTAVYYANFNMDDVKQVQFYAQPANGHNGVPFLIGNIRHDPGFVPMPQVGPKLSDCQIALIEAWVKAGALNN